MNTAIQSYYGNSLVHIAVASNEGIKELISPKESKTKSLKRVNHYLLELKRKCVNSVHKEQSKE